jgi:protein-S-isoprenylcysteine O-methyltransferase Ste14
MSVRSIRVARPATPAWNVAKTIAFMLVFWFVFLFLLPIGISVIEIDWGIQRFPPELAWAGLLLFIFTLLGLWAAITMAVVGRGTPAPFDTARSFVVEGPYAYVRHPLVIAALGQGVGLGIALGSVPVLAYIVTAAALWYYLARPAEERDLAERFGPAWREYAQAVRGFRPRLSPYRPATAHGVSPRRVK